MGTPSCHKSFRLVRASGPQPPLPAEARSLRSSALRRLRPEHNFSISLNQWIAAPEIVSVSIVGLRPQVAARRAPRALYQAEQLYNYFGSFEPAAADYNSSMIFRLYQSRAGRSLPQRRPAFRVHSAGCWPECDLFGTFEPMAAASLPAETCITPLAGTSAGHGPSRIIQYL